MFQILTDCKLKPTTNTKFSESDYEVRVHCFYERNSDYEVRMHNFYEPKSDYEVRVNNFYEPKSDYDVRVHSIYERNSDYDVRMHNFHEPKSDYEVRVHSVYERNSDCEVRVHSFYERNSDCEERVYNIYEPKSDHKVSVNNICEPESDCDLLVHSIYEPKGDYEVRMHHFCLCFVKYGNFLESIDKSQEGNLDTFCRFAGLDLFVDCLPKLLSTIHYSSHHAGLRSIEGLNRWAFVHLTNHFPPRRKQKKYRNNEISNFRTFDHANDKFLCTK